MVHFMIDWENIQHNGLRGSRYLNPSDNITIFYSKACNRIEQGDLQGILQSGCTLELCRLVNPGKNALDHYISSRIGSLFGGGYLGNVAIISRDKGFRAIQDYWKHCVKPSRNIVIRPNIESGIVSLNENTERCRQIQQEMQVVNLEKEFEKYKEEQRIRSELKKLFADTDYQESVHLIMDIVKNNKNLSKIVYLNTLKQFGKKDGLEIYRRLRQWENTKMIQNLE